MGSGTVLAVCSDPHLTSTDHGTTKVYHRTEEQFRELFADAASRRRRRRWKRPPLSRGPGNHDVPKTFNNHNSPPIERFVERYTPGTLPYRVRIGDVDLFCLDSVSGEAVTDEHGGRVGKSQLRWLEAALVETDRRGTAPVVVCHHPLAPVELASFGHCDHFRLHDAEEVLNRLSRVPLALSGHIH